ncbi:Crp/Fnr family transcriptional regulator [Kineosporia rhizophila]|uniref:Crp/Fnr family transcriptional regulator n=1 Tax=Kineosporia TaxID=49184 RepID=UPI001E628A08|nr:Crp/Fnr family transcriptional regulator [Kineosporia sp. NBRC 101677]MCE0538179.1 Crp/Fnr family transcriptional regulator [Kineosporia rhizophila]
MFPPGSFLARLQPETREHLLQLGRRRQFAADGVLMREGEDAHEVVLVLDGYVKITATTDGGRGRSAFLAIRGTGDVIGELGAIEGDVRTATAITAGAVIAVVIRARTFVEFLTRYPDAQAAVSAVTAGRLRAAVRQRLGHVDGSVRGRLARVLLELVSHWGMRSGDRVGIAVALNQSELAALVAADERSVNKVLAQLRDAQIIGTGYRQIFVLDEAELRRIASDL